MSQLADPARLDALQSTRLLDTPPEQDFDRITRLVCGLLQVDVSLISLVDATRQFFKSASGLEGPLADCTGTPLTHSFCQHVVTSEEVLDVSDARLHETLKDNPAIRDLSVVAYLGIPLRTPDGHVIGSLCAIQREPRVWTAHNREALRDFAGIVENAIALRMHSAQAEILAEKNKLLANEFNHRAKNLLAVVRSLVNLSAREAGSREELIETLAGRIDAYGFAHDALTNADTTLDLQSLLEQLLAPYQPALKAFNANGPAVELGTDQVTAVCLIIHELATNSAKYGALKNLKLPLVSWTRETGQTRVVWQEATEPPKEEPARALHKGFGTQLIAVSARKLGGEITRTFESGVMRVEFCIRARKPE